MLGKIVGIVSVCAINLVIGQHAAAATFRYASSGDVVTFDPQGTRETFTVGFNANIMEPLVRWNRDLRPEPALAESWEALSPTSWRFHLRKGVTFSNGDPFSAADVVFTIQRAKQANSPYTGLVGSIKNVKQVDPVTVDIETDGPSPILLRDLTAILILDKHWVEQHDAASPIDPAKGQENYLTRHVLGTGPFVLSDYAPGVRYVLKPNPTWWGNKDKEHNLTSVEYRPIKQDATRVAALLSGQVDLINPAPIQDIDAIKHAAGFKIMVKPGFRTLFLGMDLHNDKLDHSTEKKNPFKDISVRRAIYQAVDVSAIVKKIMRGTTVPASTIIAPGINGYSPQLAGRLPYDPEATKKLLSKAGYPNGFSFQLDCPNDRYIKDEEICVAITNMLRRVGVHVRLNAQTKAKHFQTMLSGKSNMWLVGWGADLPLDADTFLRDVMHTPGQGNGTWNPGWYSNPRVDALQAAAANELDPDKRRALIYDAFKIDKDEIGQIPLIVEPVIWAARDSVDVPQTPYDVVWLRWVRMK